MKVMSLVSISIAVSSVLYICATRILKRSKGVTCESRQRVMTLDRRAIFFFVRSRHVLRTSVIRHQGRHVSERWLVVVNVRWLNLNIFLLDAWMHLAQFYISYNHVDILSDYFKSLKIFKRRKCHGDRYWKMRNVLDTESIF